MNIARQKNNNQPINDEIRFKSVRLVASNGDMMGVVATEDAKRQALDEGLDLVLISPNPDNPVCKIMDYGKYRFEQSKREKEAKKNQKFTEVKEVQLKLTTEKHDLDVKSRNAIRFLKAEDRVKVVLKFRGREMAYKHQGFDVMKLFADACAEYGEVDRPAKIEGRNMVMYLTPNKKHDEN